MEGFSRSTGSGITKLQKKNKFREVRNGCLAAIRIKRIADSDRWVVSSLIDTHNHAIVTLSKRRYLRMNQIIPQRSRELFRSLQSSNLGPSKQF